MSEDQKGDPPAHGARTTTAPMPKLSNLPAQGVAPAERVDSSAPLGGITPAATAERPTPTVDELLEALSYPRTATPPPPHAARLESAGQDYAAAHAGPRPSPTRVRTPPWHPAVELSRSVNASAEEWAAQTGSEGAAALRALEGAAALRAVEAGTASPREPAGSAPPVVVGEPTPDPFAKELAAKELGATEFAATMARRAGEAAERAAITVRPRSLEMGTPPPAVHEGDRDSSDTTTEVPLVRRRRKAQAMALGFFGGGAVVVLLAWAAGLFGGHRPSAAASASQAPSAELEARATNELPPASPEDVAPGSSAATAAASSAAPSEPLAPAERANASQEAAAVAPRASGNAARGRAVRGATNGASGMGAGAIGESAPATKAATSASGERATAAPLPSAPKMPPYDPNMEHTF